MARHMSAGKQYDASGGSHCHVLMIARAEVGMTCTVQGQERFSFVLGIALRVIRHINPSTVSCD
jgi:hypothetical protein